MEVLLIFTNLPNKESAESLAKHLVEENLAACVSIQAPCHSVYRWQGKREEAHEIPLLIKAAATSYAAIEAAIRANHPYELPEIVAVPVSHGLPAYLDWVLAETTPHPPLGTSSC